MMSHRELPPVRYLYVVSEIYRYRRVSAAADVVHLSQSAATQALARIESLLGVRLFDRRPDGMAPTDAGEIYERRLIRILEHLRRGDSLARKKAARGADQPQKSFHKFCSPVQIRALLAIARTGSFNQAARDLGVSQPGIHRAVRELASLSGLTLFAQTRGGVILTPAAELFVQNVRLAASEFQQAVYEINELLGRDTTRIDIGSMPLSRATFLPAAIDRMLHEAGAGVQVNCVDARYHTLLRNLRFGELDVLIGALRNPVPAKGIEQKELFTDRLVVVAAPDHPLAGAAQARLQDTLKFPWIAPPRETPSGAYLFDRLRIQDMAQTPVRVVSSSLVLLRGLMARGNYVSIASGRQIEEEGAKAGLVPLAVDLPGSERAIGLSFRSGWTPTPVQQRFLDILREEAGIPHN